MRFFVALMAVICAAACSVPSPALPLAGAAPQRIVTLNGVFSETVAALGFVDRIVGTDVTSKYPARVDSLPKLGHDKGIRAEGILSLRPDLVMANIGQLDPAVEGQLRQAGIRLMLFTPAVSLGATRKLITQVADSLGRPAGALSIVARIDSGLQAVAPIVKPPKVLFIYARGAGTLLVAGAGTPIQGLISLAGGINAVTGFTGFKPLTPEALVAANPDVVLLFNTGADNLQGNAALLNVPGMAATNAGRNSAFITLDPLVMAGFGPRVGNAAAWLNNELRSRSGP